MLRVLTFSLLALLVVQPASAALQSVAPTKANGDFIPGGGIPANNFTVTSGLGGVSVALKARGRDTGQPLSIVNTPVPTYNVLPGLAANNINPWWNFDFQFSSSASGPNPQITFLTLDVDFNPGVGVESYRTLSDVATGPTWAGSFITNPGGNAWSENDTDYIVANSFNYGFAFWNVLPPGPTGYNPNTPGEYKIVFTALIDGQIQASTSILVNVGPDPAAVPEPGSMILVLGLAACGLPAAFRRRRVVA